MIRILHVIGRMNRGGAETMVMNLYRAIDRTQIQFDFVSFTDSKGDYDEEILSLGGTVYRIIENGPIKRMIALQKLLQAHPEYKIVHCHTFYSNAFHLVAARRANVPYRIAHSHNTHAASKNKLIEFVYSKIAKQFIKKYATHFMACGDAAGKFLFPGTDNVLILPNAIDTGKFAEIGETHTDYLHREFNIKNTCLKIIQVGRLVPVKNPFFSIEIANALKQQNIDFQLIFVGEGELRSQIEEKINQYNLSHEVTLLGLRSDIPQLMAGSDVMIMPSLYEGFPVVLVESQAVGIPALVSDKVSPEVDLGVDLISFMSLNDGAAEWAKQIPKMTQVVRNDTTSERLAVLKQKKFDVNESVRILTDLYKSMK